MKISDHTLSVLKNFATINPSIVLRPGPVQRTISEESYILAEATLDMDVPSEFGIYDLRKFLGNITTLDKPEIEFYTESVKMYDGTIKLVYHSCAPSFITSPGDKKLEIPHVDVSFRLTKDMLQKILNISFTNSLPMISIVGKDGEIKIKVHDNTDTTNYGEIIVVPDYAGADFVCKFKTEHVRILPDDYDVKVAFKSFALFENTSGTLRYFISFQKK